MNLNKTIVQIKKYTVHRSKSWHSMCWQITLFTHMLTLFRLLNFVTCVNYRLICNMKCCIVLYVDTFSALWLCSIWYITYRTMDCKKNQKNFRAGFFEIRVPGWVPGREIFPGRVPGLEFSNPGFGPGSGFHFEIFRVSGPGTRPVPIPVSDGLQL